MRFVKLTSERILPQGYFCGGVFLGVGKMINREVHCGNQVIFDGDGIDLVKSKL